MPEIQNISWLYSPRYNIFHVALTSANCPLPSYPPGSPGSQAYNTPYVIHPAMTLVSRSVTWHRVSFLILDMIRHLSALRDPEHCPLPEHEFLGSDRCSDQVVWTQSTRCALAWSLMGTLGTSGCSYATEQTCHGRPSQQQIKKSINWSLALSSRTCRTKITFPTFMFKCLNTI